VIDQIFVNLRDAFKSKGVPYECVYGPTRVPMKVGASRLQILRDDEAGDQVKAPRGRFQNPRMFAVLGAGMVVRIFAHDTKAGAQRYDHDVLALRLAAQVLPELHKVISAMKTTHQITRAGTVGDSTSDGWSGVVYEIRFQVDLGMFDTTWVGGANSELPMTATTTVNAPPNTSSSPAATTDLPSATTRTEA
jgi:hypothetical protein